MSDKEKEPKNQTSNVFDLKPLTTYNLTIFLENKQLFFKEFKFIGGGKLIIFSYVAMWKDPYCPLQSKANGLFDGENVKFGSYLKGFTK